MNFLENITFRRTRTKSDSNANASGGLLNETLDDTGNTLPDLSSSDDTELELTTKLKARITKLQQDLNDAHLKIGSLLMENDNLKQINQDLLKKNDLCGKNSNSPAKIPKILTPNQKDQVKHQQTQTEMVNITQKIKNNTPQNRPRYFINAEQEISSPTDRPQMKQMTGSKICILSSNKRNKIRQSAENTLCKKPNEICHYLMSHCKIEQLIYGIENKLKTFTMSDFCIILVGEEDFNTTNDYFHLISCIRGTIEKIKHTNVIICAPTYKLYMNMYNWRIENFNNLLYRDILTHEHAYYLDSNKNLTNDYKMFSKNTGSLNNYGIQTIFKDINKLINDIEKYNRNSESILTDSIPSEEKQFNNNPFFR